MYETKFHTTPINQFSFLVTGGAGFIGSHLVEYLLQHEAKKVRVLDNLLTGNKKNIDLFTSNASYEFLKGDIRSMEDCRSACDGIDFVFHEAALGSVPRSVEDPMTTHQINADGFLNVLLAAKEKKVKRVVYASSSSVYGDHPSLPKKEDQLGNPLSPYAVSKLINEQYAQVFASQYDMELIGLRYFNIFGPRQDPDGPYAAVIPRFIKCMMKDISPVIYGDGKQTRDFTFIENAVQANIKAAFASREVAYNHIYNVAAGKSFTVLQLVEAINKAIAKNIIPEPVAPRKGDIIHSLADISKSAKEINYQPDINFADGIQKTIESFPE